MWTYEQKTGWLRQPDGARLSQGYSGNGDHKNNPASQHMEGHGPIPCGHYTIELITDGEDHAVDYEGKRAPVLRLIPDAANQMFGRAGFLIHGDSVSHPGTASLGCIIQPHFARQVVAASGDKRLQVVISAA